MVRSRKARLILGLLIGMAAPVRADVALPALDDFHHELTGEVEPEPSIPNGFVPLPRPLPVVPGPANFPGPATGDPQAALTDRPVEQAPEVLAEPLASPMPSDSRWRLFGPCGRCQTSGWIDAGAPLNFSSPTSHFNGPYTTQFRDEPQLNQLYVVAEVPPDGSQPVSFGGRIDVLYGTDYLLAQSTGLEQRPDGTARWNGDGTYGLAIPQAYGEIVWGSFAMKMGHFLSVAGYESLPAPSNFFYTHSYSYSFGSPITHWGGLATVDLTEQTVLDAGIVNGWDALEMVSNHPSLIARATYYTTAQRNSRLVGSVITGDEEGNAGSYANRTRIDSFFDCLLSDRLRCVLQYQHAWQSDALPGGGAASWYGLANYTYYTLNDRWKLGGRLEWFRDQNGTRVHGALPQDPNLGPYAGSFYATTLGANWSPSANLLVRPELRFDWFDGAGLPFDDGHRTTQTLAALDAIWHF